MWRACCRFTPSLRTSVLTTMSNRSAARAADRFDIVVSTDVLSEGVNLQQARHIVNYDLPWNPMRLVQRHGRIDRIGSRYAEVFLRCIFPDGCGSSGVTGAEGGMIG